MILSAYFSGIEIAMISIQRIKFEVWARQGVKRAKQALDLIQQPERFLTTILVGNNIAVITASSILAIYLQNYLSGFSIALVSSILLLLVGEILPKTIAHEKSSIMTLYFSPLLRFFYIIFHPIIWLVSYISKLLLSIAGLDKTSVRYFFTRKDLDLIIRESEQSGLVDKRERDMISRFVLRGNQKVKEIMTPRTEMKTINRTASAKKLQKLFVDSGHSRIPVYDRHIDNIVGMVTAIDFLLDKSQRIHQLIRDVLFIPETITVRSLMKAMQKKRMWMGIVVDEYGGTLGMVTMEDLVEEFFGEIHDEFDDRSTSLRNITREQFDAKASMEISALNERFHLNLPSGDYQSLGGFVINRLGRIPKKGDILDTETCVLTIRSASKKKIGWISVKRKTENGRKYRKN